MVRSIELPPVPEGPDRPTILARVYPGTHERAVELFQQDAELLAGHGYLPVGQSYADGRYPLWMVAVALVLCLIVIGIALLAVMAAVRPEGTLAVTYELRSHR
jgi:hypothetical protein